MACGRFGETYETEAAMISLLTCDTSAHSPPGAFSLQGEHRQTLIESFSDTQARALHVLTQDLNCVYT